MSNQYIDNLQDYGNGLANSLLGIARFTGENTNHLLQRLEFINENQAEKRSANLNELLTIHPKNKNTEMYDLGGLVGLVLGGKGLANKKVLTTPFTASKWYMHNGDKPIVKGVRQGTREIFERKDGSTTYFPSISKELPANMAKKLINSQFIVPIK